MTNWKPWQNLTDAEKVARVDEMMAEAMTAAGDDFKALLVEGRSSVRLADTYCVLRGVLTIDEYAGIVNNNR